MNQTQSLPVLSDDQLPPSADPAAGFGNLSTERGTLPLVAMDVRHRLCGLAAEIRLVQTFVNSTAEPVEATYIFSLPDWAAVTEFELRVGDRVIAGVLKERAAARAEYEQAIQDGHRAAIAEENRPNVFSLRVGNLLPGERAVVTLALAGPLEYADGEATFRFPLVVAPRYIPGLPLSGESAGPGTAPDTNLVPDASLLTPPVLLPGFPNPVRLSLEAHIEPAGLTIGEIRSSLHATSETDGTSGRRTIRIQPGERLNRDFILRMKIAERAIKSSLVLSPDAKGSEGTFLLTLVPPAQSAAAQRPRDVVLLLDRSGSMGGWKIVAARRAAARIVDSLLPDDRFTVLAFDDTVEAPEPPADSKTVGHTADLLPATDRNRFRAVEFLARLDARGGTELAQPLASGAKMLAAANPDRDRILVLVTDGQVGNEDHLLQTIASSAREIRIFTLGIDQAVNAGFLRRLAALGGGACDLVESEDRLDAVMDKIQRTDRHPLAHRCKAGGERSQARRHLARARPLTRSASRRAAGRAGAICRPGERAARGDRPRRARRSVVGRAAADRPQRAVGRRALARGRIRDLEDRFAAQHAEELEQQIVATSLQFGVLSRFTAFVAVDRLAVANPTGKQRQIVQPVELPAGWEEQAVMGSGTVSAMHCLAAGPPSRSVACYAPPPAASNMLKELPADDAQAFSLRSIVGSIFGSSPR